MEMNFLKKQIQVKLFVGEFAWIAKTGAVNKILT